MPDGRHFVFVIQPGNRVAFGSLDDSDVKELFDADSKAVYAPPGYLLYARQGALQAQPFNPRQGTLTGAPVQIADAVRSATVNARGAYSVSDTGILVYRAGTQSITTHLQWFDRQGHQLDEALSWGDVRELALSPDRRRVAFHRHEEASGGGIWIKDLERGTVNRLTFDSAHNHWAIWHPDGRHIAYVSTRDSAGDIYLASASGTADHEPLLRSPEGKYWLSWSPDGRYLLFGHRSAATQSDIAVLDVATHKVMSYIHGPASETHPEFSPDGKWVAYASDESSRFEVYVQPFPATGDKWPISTAGGSHPRWRADGGELFFMGPDRTLMSATVAVHGDRLDAGVPAPLFRTRAVFFSVGPIAPYRVFDTSLDGMRFLIAEESPDARSVSDPLTVVVNWTALLKR